MSVTHISAELRRLVLARADYLCEYCLIAEVDTFHGCQIDHIISEKHDGPTTADNLALACAFCNRGKGSDIGSIHWETRELVHFFHPRTDRWADHFVLSGSRIEGLTKIGLVTARILGFNDPDRVLERQVLQAEGLYPSKAALLRMGS